MGGASPPRGIGLAHVPGGGWCVHRNRANWFSKCLQMPFMHMASPSLRNCSRRWTALLSHFTDERKGSERFSGLAQGAQVAGTGLALGYRVDAHPRGCILLSGPPFAVIAASTQPQRDSSGPMCPSGHGWGMYLAVDGPPLRQHPHFCYPHLVTWDLAVSAALFLVT